MGEHEVVRDILLKLPDELQALNISIYIRNLMNRNAELEEKLEEINSIKPRSHVPNSIVARISFIGGWNDGVKHCQSIASEGESDAQEKR